MNSENEKKKCSYCGEEIPAQAGRCPFCGSLLDVVIDAGTAMPDPWGNGEVPAGNNANGSSDTANTTPVNSPPANIPPVNNASSQVQAANPASAYTQQDNEYGSAQPVRQNINTRRPLSNGMKVFLTVLFTVIPGLGQLAGIITAIVFMNTDDDPDRKSFGVAILVAALIMFALSCIGCFIGIIAASAANYSSLQYIR